MNHSKKTIKNLRGQIHDLELDIETLELQVSREKTIELTNGWERDNHHKDSISFQLLSVLLSVLLITAVTYGVIESRENSGLTRRIEVLNKKLLKK